METSQTIIKKSKRESFLKFSETLQHRRQSDTSKPIRNSRRGRMEGHMELRKMSPSGAKDEGHDDMCKSQIDIHKRIGAVCEDQLRRASYIRAIG